MTPHEWRAEVATALQELADDLGEFSTNDLWPRVPAPPEGAKRQDVAAVLKALQREGVVRPTERHVKSDTGTRHGGLTRVWAATWYRDAFDALPTTAHVRHLVQQYGERHDLTLQDALERLVKLGLTAEA